MKIRIARIEDANEILWLLRSTPELQGIENLDESIYSDDFVKASIGDKEMNLVLVAVAEEQDKIQGVLIAEMWQRKGFSFLADLAVHPEYSRKGIGRELYKEYESICGKRNIFKVVGLVQVENTKMKIFCERFGLQKGKCLFYYQKSL
jgi:ribosomal protein S18 acetylase RimI-like enzyme